MTKEAFYTKWLEVFACGISKKEIRKYVKPTGDFIWHIFSWRLLNEGQYLKGNEAKETYDKIHKKDAIYIDWFRSKQTENLTCDLYTAKVLDDFDEIYVVGKDFKWTYIKTHEEHCGPYFVQSK